MPPSRRNARTRYEWPYAVNRMRLDSIERQKRANKRIDAALASVAHGRGAEVIEADLEAAARQIAESIRTLVEAADGAPGDLRLAVELLAAVTTDPDGVEPYRVAIMELLERYDLDAPPLRLVDQRRSG